MNPYRTWQSTLVQRWHANPHLAGTGDTVGSHQCRVALLMLHLKPDVSRAALIAAIAHDTGEIRAGDVPYDAKQADADLRARIEAVEWAERQHQGLPLYNLNPQETKLLKLCDWLDAYLWAALRAYGLLARPDWREQYNRMEALAIELNVIDRFRATVVGAFE